MSAYRKAFWRLKGRAGNFTTSAIASASKTSNLQSESQTLSAGSKPSPERIDFVSIDQPGVATWLDAYPRMVARFAGTGGKLPSGPTTIIVHSGNAGAGVAEYFRHPWDSVRNRWRPYWTHFAWSRKHDGFAQCDSLDNKAVHCRGWNNRSIGIELPGPWHWNPRPVDQLAELQWLIDDIVRAVPSVTRLARHCDLDPERKKDPGPGCSRDWLASLGLEVW